MTDLPTTVPEKKKASRRRKAEPLPIVRDATFTRAVADRFLTIDLGRDIELACLQAGSEALEINDEGNAERIALRPAFTEVVRLRLGWPSATDLAMQIVQIGVAKGLLNSDKVIEAISRWSEHGGSQADKSTRDAD